LQKKIEMKKISIITPIYNESKNIVDCCDSVKKFFYNKKNYDYEHILIDNCSTDDGLKKIKIILEEDKKIKLIINAKNYGIMPSLFNALKFTSGDAVLTCYACDMQDPIEFLEKFIRKWEEGYEVVYAIRKKRNENYLLTSIKLIYYKLYNLLSYGVKKDNFVSVFQFVDKSIVEKLVRFETSYPHIPSMINSLTSNSVGVETEWIQRTKELSKNNFFALVKEALITLIQFTTFLPMIAFIAVIFIVFSLLSLLLLGIFTNIAHDLFLRLLLIAAIFSFVLLFILIFFLFIKIYYLTMDIRKDHIVLVKKTYNL
jgi:polyisoprenyl-phosphate glycosyltransferase